MSTSSGGQDSQAPAYCSGSMEIKMPNDPYNAHNGYPTGTASNDAFDVMKDHNIGIMKNWDWKKDGYPTEDAIQNRGYGTIPTLTNPND